MAWISDSPSGVRYIEADDMFLPDPFALPVGHQIMPTGQ